MKFFTLIFAATLILLGKPVSAQQEQLFMLDFVFMSKGHTLADRDKHNANARPIASRYGIEMIGSLDAKSVFIGPKGLSRLDLWTMPNKSALRSWGADPDYALIKDNAFKIHDLDQLTLYLSQERQNPQIESDNIYYVELLTFNKQNFSAPKLVSYIKNSDAVAKEYGLFPVGRFNPLSRLAGKGPEANLLQIYLVRAPNLLEKWAQDTRYKALNPARKTLFDTKNMMIGVFKAN